MRSLTLILHSLSSLSIRRRLSRADLMFNRSRTFLKERGILAFRNPFGSLTLKEPQDRQVVCASFRCTPGHIWHLRKGNVCMPLKKRTYWSSHRYHGRPSHAPRGSIHRPNVPFAPCRTTRYRPGEASRSGCKSYLNLFETRGIIDPRWNISATAFVFVRERPSTFHLIQYIDRLVLHGR